jgi:excisionase family DNA binding protein
MPPDPSHHLSLHEAADRLGVHYMTAYRYIRTGRLAGVKDGHEWQVDAADVDALKRAVARQEQQPARRRRTRRTDYPRRLVDRLVGADEAGAWSLIESSMTGGMSPDQIYLELLTPALETIGDRWARGEITVAQEHQASAIVLRLIGRLGPLFARRGRKRGIVLVGCPPLEVHGLPSALLSDLLRARSFDVHDLGADVPADSWAVTAGSTDRLVAVGLCATTPGHEQELADTIAALRAATESPIFLGGRAITSEKRALALGATAYSGSFDDAVELVEGFAAARR